MHGISMGSGGREVDLFRLARSQALARCPTTGNNLTRMDWPFSPPIETMEAKVMETWPSEGKFRYAYEPKWDGFRAVAWSGPDTASTPEQKPLLR